MSQDGETPSHSRARGGREAGHGVRTALTDTVSAWPRRAALQRQPVALLTQYCQMAGFFVVVFLPPEEARDADFLSFPDF